MAMVRSAYDLFIFDVDGTLVRTKSRQAFRTSAEDWEFIPGRAEAIRERVQFFKERGVDVSVALASNQGGVAFGYLERDDIQREIEEVGRQIGAASVLIEYSHPKASIEAYRVNNSYMRKPNPGMLLVAIHDAGTEPGTALMIGDRPEDEDAAMAAGCAFMHADTFFDQSDRAARRAATSQETL